MTQETLEQRIERLARAYWQSREGRGWEHLNPDLRNKILNSIKDIIASDKEANWPFNPETHVVVPREPTADKLNELEAERENLKDREIALLEQAVVEAAQLNELKKEIEHIKDYAHEQEDFAERMEAVVETVREYFACGGRGCDSLMHKALKELDEK